MTTMLKLFLLLLFWISEVACSENSTNSQDGVSGNSSSPALNQLTKWSSINSNKCVPYATTNGGVPVPSLTASQAIGSRGHVLLQDSFLLEMTASFNRERIPERVVHAKGAGAFGYFEVTNDISHLTKAKFLSPTAKKTKVAVRFSTVGGELGSGDTWIDPKGFAVKFYTEDGIHDLVGNNIEIFPIRDAMLFADLNRSRKRNPQTHLRDPTMWWDFTALRPETALHTLHLFSNKGTPSSFRAMDGAGVHTFKLVHAKGHATVYVKFHWLSNQPKRALTRKESADLAGSNGDYLIQDLYDAIENKDYPSWNLSIQVMTFDQAGAHPQNPFDSTKHWRREEYPLIPVGRMTLDRNPKNYFTDVEQIAFSPSNMVPGIEASPDRLLHARMFSYPDAQRYRLGVNFHQLYVNKCPFKISTYNRDGQMQTGSNGKGSPNYFPNSFNGVNQNPGGGAGVGVGTPVAHTKFYVTGDVDRVDTGEDDNFSLARIFLQRDVDVDERNRIVEDIADFLRKADVRVQQLFLKNIAYPISQEFGDALKNELDNVVRLSPAPVVNNNNKFVHYY